MYPQGKFVSRGVKRPKKMSEARFPNAGKCFGDSGSTKGMGIKKNCTCVIVEEKKRERMMKIEGNG